MKRRPGKVRHSSRITPSLKQRVDKLTAELEEMPIIAPAPPSIAMRHVDAVVDSCKRGFASPAYWEKRREVPLTPVWVR